MNYEATHSIVNIKNENGFTKRKRKILIFDFHLKYLVQLFRQRLF